MSSPARLQAVRLLTGLLSGRRRLESGFTEPGFLELDPRDRRLTTQLVYGTLRQLGRLDYYLGELSDRPLEKLDEAVLWTLRISLFQLEFLRVPQRAAIHDAPDLVRRLGKGSASGFVNAVLRSFVRRRPPLPQGDSARDLAVRLSHPRWLVERYLDRWGPEATRRWLECNNRPPRPVLWVNPFKTSPPELCGRLEAEGIEYRLCRELPGCLTVQAANFAEHPACREGHCLIMDAASQTVAHRARLAGCGVVGDFCCAPGGKAFVLASRLEPGARLWCCDISQARLGETVRRARSCGLPGFQAIAADLTRPAPFSCRFDFVLLDAPCSGLGTLRSRPDIRWRRKPEQLPGLQERQLAMARNSLAALRPGGELLYVTCSTEPEENGEVVERLLEQEPEARLVEQPWCSFPGEHPGQGFFAARISKAGGD